MYLRGLRYRTHHGASIARTATKTRSGASPLPRVASRVEQGASRPYSKPTEQHESGHGGSKSSIRPLTVFALCLPLGFALSWVLNRQDGESKATSDGFVRYTLRSKEPVSSTCSIFTVQPATSTTIDTDDPAYGRAITSVQFKQPQLQIARNYTILPPRQGQNSDELRFLIRKERNGEVSGYLHRLPIGTEIELRGLHTNYLLPDKVHSVVFLAGGTGIAPAMQVANALAGEADVHILWACRRREDCRGGQGDTPRRKGWNMDFSGWWSPFGLPSADAAKSRMPSNIEESTIVAQLGSLKAKARSTQHKLLVDYYVDEEDTFVRPKDVADLISRETTATVTGSGNRLLLVSGPEGFVTYWAGPKQWVDGKESQGPLGGQLSTLALDGWKVVKL